MRYGLTLYLWGRPAEPPTGRAEFEPVGCFQIHPESFFEKVLPECHAHMHARTHTRAHTHASGERASSVASKLCCHRALPGEARVFIAVGFRRATARRVVKMTRDDVFVDLGSGTGKVVLQVCLALRCAALR